MDFLTAGHLPRHLRNVMAVCPVNTGNTSAAPDEHSANNLI
jgi:hypothetical protein